MTKNGIAFIDLMAQKKRLGNRIEQAIQRVLDQGHFIMGPEVKVLEEQLSQFCGAKHALSCSNGTDALALILMAKEIGPGDAVFVPSFTFASTAEVVVWMGATPIFVDVLPDTFNMDPASLKRAIVVAKSMDLKPKTVITVDLFGQPADYDAIEPICQDEGLWILCDAAQSFGAAYKGRNVGTMGLATSTSFYPAKPLGCYGDGGAVFTEDDNLAEIMRSIRVHGQGTDKYDNVRIGMNGRLDTVQAVVLIEKLSIFADEIEARNQVAVRYHEGLQNVVQVPFLMEDVTSVWAQYTVRVPNQNRDALMKGLAKEGVPTVIYYPKLLHQQTAYKHFPTADSLSVSEALSKEVLSLPMHPYLTEEMQQEIIDKVVSVSEKLQTKSVVECL